MKTWTTRADWTRSLAEFIATFLFVLLAVGSVGAALPLGGPTTPGFLLVVGLGQGVAIMIGVIAFGRISGAHMNPAVTIATVITRDTSLVRGLMYVAAQLAGAVLAIAVLDGVAFELDDLGLHQLAPYISKADGLVIEIVLTFFLVLVVFATAVDRCANAALAPFAIGGVVALGGFVALVLTGASMNPARSFGPAAFFGNFTDHWVYWAGPIIGGVMAALVYANFFADKDGTGMVGRIKLRSDDTQA